MAINHEGLELAESVEHFVKHAFIALANKNLGDFLELVDSAGAEAQSIKNQDNTDPKYGLSNARILCACANLRVMMVICESMVNGKPNPESVQISKDRIRIELQAAKNFIKIAQIEELSPAFDFAYEKLNSILDRHAKIE